MGEFLRRELKGFDHLVSVAERGVGGHIHLDTDRRVAEINPRQRAARPHPRAADLRLEPVEPQKFPAVQPARDPAELFCRDLHFVLPVDLRILADLKLCCEALLVFRPDLKESFAGMGRRRLERDLRAAVRGIQSAAVVEVADNESKVAQESPVIFKIVCVQTYTAFPLMVRSSMRSRASISDLYFFLSACNSRYA